MGTQLLYRDLARYYDLIYSEKDYEKEAEKLKKIISRYKKSEGNELLDVACGTGKHLLHLKKWFSCTGIDLNGEILDVAKKNVPGVVFKRADMLTMSFAKRY